MIMLSQSCRFRTTPTTQRECFPPPTAPTPLTSFATQLARAVTCIDVLLTTANKIVSAASHQSASIETQAKTFTRNPFRSPSDLCIIHEFDPNELLITAKKNSQNDPNALAMHWIESLESRVSKLQNQWEKHGKTVLLLTTLARRIQVTTLFCKFLGSCKQVHYIFCLPNVV